MTRGYYARNKNIKISKFVVFQNKALCEIHQLTQYHSAQSVFWKWVYPECRSGYFDDHLYHLEGK